MAVVEALEALLLLQVGEQRVGSLAVDLDFRELRERHAEPRRAELRDLLVRAGRLVAELVAREVEDVQASLMQRGVQLLELGVRGREAALSGGVHHQQHATPVVGERHVVALLILYGKVIDAGSHGSFFQRGVVLRL